MSKFNKNTNNTNVGIANTVNLAGSPAYSRDYKNEVVSVVMNCLLNGDSYYQSDKARIVAVEALLKQGLRDESNAEFLAKAMVYTRTQGNLRSVTHLMGAILSENVKHSDFMRPALASALIRPDDALEMASLLFDKKSKGYKLPNVFKRAVRDSLETKWDEYQLKKYECTTKSVKLKDLVILTHPNPAKLVESGKAKDPFVFKRIIEESLSAIETAQTVNAGSTGEARASNYKDMLTNKKLGYMGALKNIKNILNAGADTETVDMLCKLLTNERALRNSMVLPFRFVQAYVEVQALNYDRIKIKQVLKAIEDAFILSAKNVPIVEDGESVAILLDESGSMGGWGSESLTSTSPFMLGKTLMASMLTGLDKTKTVGYLWADNSREISVNGSPFEFMTRTKTQGGGTDIAGAFNGLVRTKTNVDKIVIITDMQHNSLSSVDSKIREYKKNINPNVKVLFWNIQGYGKGTPVRMTGEVLEMNGFNDKMLDVAAKMLKYSDVNYLVKEIESISLLG